MEAAARHRRLHDVRALHSGVPGPRDRQAARPTRDRAEDRRGHGRDRARPPVSPPIGVDPRSRSRANSLFERITAEEIWACTTCKACDEICPVNIEILDKILDMRRYLSLMESQLPARARHRVPGDGEPGQPVGHEPGRARRLGQEPRWRQGRRRPGRRSSPSTSTGSVAPASFDDKNKKVTQAMAKLLDRAGIDVRHPRPVGDVHRRPRAPLAATSTSSRCSPCRTSRRSTAWA